MDYDDMLRRNIRAARARLGIGQPAVARRMAALGFGDWNRVIVGNIELGRRDLNAFEILGLAVALETTIADLMDAHPIHGTVEFVPGGDEIGAVSVHNSVKGINDGTVTWHDDTPAIIFPGTPWSSQAGDLSALAN